MRAHWGVDAAGARLLTMCHDLAVQPLPHAVQTLELVLAVGEGSSQLLRHADDAGDGVGVVGSELGKDGLGFRQHAVCAGQVRDVRMVLAGVHRVVGKSFGLGALDLAVPVGTLDQPNHESVPSAASKVHDEIDDCWAALLVSLHHKPDPSPTVQAGCQTKGLQQVQRQVQAF